MSAIVTSDPGQVTLLGALRNIGRGLFHATAKFASYGAALPTATTRIGSRTGSNLNSTLASIQISGMQWTSEDLQKNAPLGMAYLRVRANYCRPTRWNSHADDPAVKKLVQDYCSDKWRTMGMACSMQAAVARTLHIETPIRGDAGMIFWRDESDDLRLIEFSADQVGEVYNFTLPRACSLIRNSSGELVETSGADCTYFRGRYFRGADCVAYKIYERADSWYGRARIYAAADVIYTVDPFNFRSHRGITIFHNVMNCIQKGEDLLQAGISAAQRQARTAMMVFNERGQPDEGSYETDVFDDGRVNYYERQPGGPMVEYFYRGDSASFASPDSPGPELIEGVQQMDQRFCIGLGMTYAFVVSGEKLGGAISRLDANRSGNEIERLRDDLSTPCLNRIAEVTILDGVRRGDLPTVAGITKGHWSYVNLPTADAFRDSMDDIKSVRAGQDSDTRVLARYGTTPAEIMRDKEEETFLAYQSLHNVQRRLKEAGIPLTPSIADIKQITENPMQAAQAEVVDKGGELPRTEAARLSAWDESKHPRDEGGKFGEGASHGAASADANAASDKAHNDPNSPILHDRAAASHHEAIGHKKARIESVRSDPHLKESEKKKLIAGYKKDIRHHEFMRDAHSRAASETDEIHKRAETEAARLFAFVGDVQIGSLPTPIVEEIAKHIQNGDDGIADLLVTRYGMVVPELLAKADSHNLETARRHIRYCTNGSCSEEVHANDEKVILIMNDRIIDGHHFLAKAEKGRVSKSLPVIDLTPARFQTARLAK